MSKHDETTASPSSRETLPLASHLSVLASRRQAAARKRQLGIDDASWRSMLLPIREPTRERDPRSKE